MKVTEVLNEFKKLNKEAEVLEKKAALLKDKAQVLMEKSFGVRDGSILSTETFVETIANIIKINKNES